MLFSWLKHRRRQRLESEPLPKAWRHILSRNAHHYHHLSPPQRERLENKVKVFVAEKWWEGCDGLEITDEVKVTIAGNACLLLLGIDDDYCFDRVNTVLVYPKVFLHRPPRQPQAGVLTDVRPSVDEGLSQNRGPVVFSWDDVLRGGRGRDDRGNVVVHEMAHKLDELNGHADGTPPLPDKVAERTWEEVVGREFRHLREDLEQGRHTLIDPYGATNRAEFFAVISETFFERPVELRSRHGELYVLLRQFYRLDPAEWREPAARHAGQQGVKTAAHQTAANDAAVREELAHEAEASAPPGLSHAVIEGTLRDLAAALRGPSGQLPSPLGRAALCICGGDCHRSLHEYDRLVRLSPHDPRPLLLRALAHIGREEYSEAVADSDAALELSHDDDAAALRVRALGHLGARQYARAVDDSRRALERSPDDLEALFLRAIAHEGAGEGEAALADFGRVISLAPDWADAYAERARVLARLGRQDEAEADRRAALQREPALRSAIS